MRTLVLGAGAGAGLWLILAAVLPGRPPLAHSLAVILTPPAGSPRRPVDDGSGWVGRLGRPMTGILARWGLPGGSIRRDLVVLGRPVERHLAEKAAAALLGLVVPPVLAGLMSLGGAPVPVVIPVWASLAAAAGGFVTPDLVVRSQARERRAQFRQTVSVFLDLVVLSLAGGAGVEAAMHDAAGVGSGWAFQQMRDALARGQTARITPWQSLGRLGADLDIPELTGLAATMSLAGTEGARVRASLAAKAETLRSRELTDAEAHAQAATERMSLPVVLLFAGFFAFIIFPAVVHVGTAL